MKDVQSERDHRNIPIDKVGIKNLRYPIRVKDRRDGSQSTIASINMYVDLPQEYKGTHMSRFVEMLHLLNPEISLKKFSVLLETMKHNLDAASAHIEVRFPYFIEKQAPVSHAPGLMDYNCRIIGSSNSKDDVDLISEVNVPITSVCPCSKEISDFGAHNQRGIVQLQTRFKKFIWLEDMIELIESCASCDVFSVLKRVDEKNVTERGFSNPKFVEDVVRDISERLNADDNITWFSVSAENFESIHNHSAYAQITKGLAPDS
ncbi:GTP cyclohydrolase FolE2 [Desulfosarcina alkanivorans]|uniref:GTP cyclohydrolase FolE2 n=1 Tax=Desulfosarcina alkanivorans TaxID=571177 RepID=A0A5K7YPQ5_9BACT|nr:GTP cyclohydrolase FolE2 [Desulfosarcina alkanivorans]BBO66597.1 GTP cyclohydrolase FolE2 [Desulfosarcina alkanivorans]